MRTDTERFWMKCIKRWTFCASVSFVILWMTLLSCVITAQENENLALSETVPSETVATETTTAADETATETETTAANETAAVAERTETSTPPRNQLIYIPYEKLKKTFEKEGRGVFLPYEQFQELWNAAQANREPVSTESTAPVDWVITDAENVAFAEADVVHVTSTIRFEILKKGWFAIPLRLGDAAILSATLDGQTARVVPDETDGFKLLVENPSDKESRFGVLTLEFAKKIERSPGKNAVSFQTPQVPVSRWTAKIVEPGVDVLFSPMLATSLVEPETEESQSGIETPKPETVEGGNAGRDAAADESKYGTVVRAFVGAAPEVRIEWTARTEGATGLTALAGVQTDQKVTIGESVLRNRVTMVWTISRAEIPTLTVKIPSDQKIINVFDPNVKQWSVEPWNTPAMESVVPSDGTETESTETASAQVDAAESKEPAEPTSAQVDAAGSKEPAEPTSAQVDAAESKEPAEPTSTKKFQKLVVMLFEPAKKSQTLVIETEKFSETQTLDESVEVAIPVFEALDVSRQQGLVEVQVESGIRAELVRSGSLLRIDMATENGTDGSGPMVQTVNMPPTSDGLAGVAPPWSGAWRYATAAFDLVLKLEKIQPRIRANLLSEVEIRPDQRVLRTTAEYWVEDAGTFELTLDVPEDYDVQTLHGRGYLDVQSAAIAGWTLDAPVENPAGPKTRLTIRLARKTLGKIGIQVWMIPKKKDGVELNAITDATSDANTETSKNENDRNVSNTSHRQNAQTMKWRFAMPTMRDLSVADVNHTLVVLAPERLQVSVEMDDAIVASPAEVYLNTTPVENTEIARSPIPPMISISSDPADSKRVVPVAAFLVGRTPTTMEITAVPRKPQISVRQFLRAYVDEGQVQYEATFFYDIRYSGVAQLRLEVPTSITATLQNNTTGIYDTTPETISTDLPNGYVTKAYRSDSELLGTRTIQLAWKEKIPSLEPGQKRRVVIPRLIPIDVTTAWGQIGISKAEAIDVTIAGDSEGEQADSGRDAPADTAAESSLFAGLQPIDPRYDLMAGISSQGVTSAFSFFNDSWTLPLDVTRYAVESPADTCVEKAFVQMVLTRAQKISVQAVWKFQSARQRLSLWLPPGATLESQPRLDGKPIVLEKGEAAEEGRGAWFYLPIPTVDPDHQMLLQLRYTTPADTGTVLRETDTKPTLPGMSIVLPLPKLGRETPVQKMMVATWIPKEFQPIDHGGAWSLVSETCRFDSGTHDPKITAELVERLPEDVANQRKSEWSDFPVDGNETVFVAVGPTGDEPLELRYLKRTYLELFIFGVTLLVGLLVWFVPRSLRGRLVAIGLVGILAAILYLLSPDIGILSSNVMLGFGAAMLVNVGIWTLSCGWMLWRCLRRRKSKLAQQTAQPSAILADSGTAASESVETDQTAHRAEEENHD